MSKDLTKKINEIDDLTQSQLTRLQMQNQTYRDLMMFLQSYIQRVISGNDLKSTVERQILNRLTDEEEEISMNALIQLLAIMNKDDSDKALGILGVLKESTKVIINNTPPENIENVYGNRKNDGILSQEETEAAKSVIKKLSIMLEKTELNPEEKKK